MLTEQRIHESGRQTLAGTYNLILQLNYAVSLQNDMDRLRRMSIIEEGTPKYVRMA